MLSFLNAWMLLGALLIAIPITIHLLNRSRFQVRAWGAMMFLRQAVQIRAQRVKLEQVILLLIRCAFLALLALALARPVFQWGEGSLKDPTSSLVILDGSYSMQQGQGEENAFYRARDAALQILETMRDSDNMLVMRAGNNPKALFPEFSFDRQFLREQILAQKPGVEQTTDLPKLMEQAYWHLEQSTLPRRRIIFLTDGQRHGWKGEDKDRWKKAEENRSLMKVKPSTYVLARRPKTPVKNIAITAVHPRSPVVDTHRTAQFIVELNNYTADRQKVRLRFAIDGEVSSERDVECPPGAGFAEFEHSFADQDALPRAPSSAGSERRRSDSHYVRVELEQDDLEPDNVFCLALDVNRTIPILVIEGGESADLWDADGGLLELALSSAADPQQVGLFDVSRKTVAELGEIHAAFLSGYKVVALANVPSLSRNSLFAFEQFVERGGGMLIALGDRVDAEAYNRMSGGGKGLIPVEIGAQQAYERRPFRPSFPPGAAAHILDVFDVSRARVLDEVRVEKFLACKPAEDAQTFGFFENMPFLVYRPYGAGRVVVWSTSANCKWTNFPLTQDYLPLVQNLAIFLGAAVHPPVNLGQGETIVYALPSPSGMESAPGSNTCTIVAPDGKSSVAKGEFIGGEWVVEWQDTELPGVYAVNATGAPPKYYAVAYEPGEGELKPLGEEEKRGFREDTASEFVNTLPELEEAIARETGTREWWRILLFLGLLALCTELYLGWGFDR